MARRENGPDEDGRDKAGRLADRLTDRLVTRGGACGAGLGRMAEDLTVAKLAWSETNGTERIALSVEKRLSGLMAVLFGRWTVLGALGGEEVAPDVLYLQLAFRMDDDGATCELGVELERGEEPLWSVMRVPAGSPETNPGHPGGARPTISDWPDARQGLIDWWAGA